MLGELAACVVRGLTAGDIFRLHPKIRWAALSRDGSLVFCTMRPEVQSFTDDAEDRAFMELGPIFLTGVAERLTPQEKAGKLESVIACFEKGCVMLVNGDEGNLAVSVARYDAFDVFKEIMPSLAKLMRNG
jgi:hypothetical protein